MKSCFTLSYVVPSFSFLCAPNNSYSTEHFQSILDYKKAALNYGILAGLSLWVTAYLVYGELNRPNRGAPSAEKEIELLPTINGALA